MNSRQKEVQQLFLDNEKAVLKKLEANYQDALFEIDDKIERLLARDDANLQNVIYQVEYQKSLKSQLQTILETLHNNEFETVSEYLTKSYEDGFLGTMYDLQGQGVSLVIPIDQEQVVVAIEHETKLSEGLYAALGKDTKRLSKQIASEISRGISNNATYGEMARNIASFSNIPKNNAARIARTEAHRIQCKATADAQWKAKEKGADVVKQWDASLDGKTRDTHRELDGQIRELDEPFEVAGMKAMQPGGFGIASEDCNCRCALLQRARWALENDFTKWDQETGGLVEIKAKDYDDFKMKYAKESERVRSSTQKMNDDTLGKSNTKSYNEYALNDSTDKWAKEAKTELLSYESNIASRQKETAVVYDNDGKILFRKYGSESEVSFKISELLKLKGKVVTHNHPSGGSFSVGDINLLRIGKMSELRVATENGSYYLRYPEKWNKAIDSKQKIQQERNKIISEIKGKYQQMYLDGEINKTQRFQMCSDEANRVFAERFGLEYGKETNEN